MNSFRFEFLETSLRIGEERVATIDQHVALAKQWRDFTDNLIDGIARLNHYHRFARRLQRADKILDCCRGRNVLSLCASGDEFFRDGGGAIENNDGKTLRFHIEGKIFPHDREPDEANIRLRHNAFSISFGRAPNEKAVKNQVERMANHVCEVALVDGPLETERSTAGEGAVVEFFGNVRPLENGRRIVALEYEAHVPMAAHQLRQVAETAVESFSLLAVTLHHRIGRVEAGETSLFVRVAALHRGAAFEASAFIVDELKRRVPIWKKPIFADAPLREFSNVT
jgi:molybdopterin synthase catalytic subunit